MATNSRKKKRAGRRTSEPAGPSPSKRARRRPPERAGGGAADADHPRPGKAEPVAKVAPWRQWQPVALRTSIGEGKYPVQFTVSGLGRSRDARYSKLITSAARKHFKIDEPPRKGEGPAAYLVGKGQRLRVVYDELIVQFKPRVPPARCSAILEATGFREVERNRLVESKWIVRHARPGVAGESLLAAADKFKRFKEVLFAWPNSVAEYVRASNTAPLVRDWWLENIGINLGGTRVLALGDSATVVAILDDGVEVGHPNLASRIAANLGRDYAVAVNQLAHKDPGPKVQAIDEEGDYHGTACAGLICSDGSQQQFVGAAPGCTLVPVRVIDGDDLINEGWLADAIVYATGLAHVISCSWNGEEHSDVVTALNNTIQGRGGKGVAVFCAAGNDGGDVAFPATHSLAIAVGACTHLGQQTTYSNTGDLDVVAPSRGSGATVFTTDVSQLGWGYNTAAPPPGLFHTDFGGTSASTAIAAGVGALCLSANPNLTAAQLRKVLQRTATKIGGTGSYDAQTQHGPKFGYGCIDAAAAVALAQWMLAHP